MQKDEPKKPEVTALRDKIVNLGKGGKSDPAPAAADESDIVVTLPPGSVSDDDTAVAPGEPAHGLPDDLDYDGLTDADDANAAPGKGRRLSGMQRLALLVAGLGIFAVVIFKGVGGMSGGNPAVPELSESALEAPPAIEPPPPNMEGDAPELTPLDGQDVAAGDPNAMPALDGQAPAEGGASAAASADAAAASVPEAAKDSGNQETNPFAPPAGTDVGKSPAAKPEPIAAPKALASIPPPVAAPATPAPLIAAPASAGDETSRTNERLSKVERDLAQARKKLKEHEKLLKEKRSADAVAADGRPSITVRWIASAAKNCAECKAKAFIVSNGRESYVASGDQYLGYKVTIEGDRLILSNGKSSYSYYSDPAKS